jgi:hypothetical protein
MTMNKQRSLCWLYLLIPLACGFRSSVIESRFAPDRLALTLQAHEAIDNENSEQQPDQCPFSKSFPRYRIDLTSVKEKADSWNKNLPFVKTITNSMARSKFQTKYRNDQLTWEEDLDGVPAMSLLWNRAADGAPRSEVIALPGASKRLVQNWVEIVEWMLTQPELEQPNSPLLQVTLLEDDDYSIPAVRIQISSSSVTTTVSSSDQNMQQYTPINLEESTQAWVKRILIDQGICPFTKSVRRSGQGLSEVGVPVGNIAYHSSLTSDVLRLFADSWSAIAQMLEAGPDGKDGVSSILMMAPAFDDNFDVFSGPIFAMLEAGVVAAGATRQVGVVCFHPRYATPDGTTWPGFGHMHSVPRLQKWHSENQPNDCPADLTTDEIAAGGAWQRRTPHATINVLRADQLEAAESMRTTGKLYALNIDNLVGRKNGIGSDKLALDLALERRIGQQQEALQKK